MSFYASRYKAVAGIVRQKCHCCELEEFFFVQEKSAVSGSQLAEIVSLECHSFEVQEKKN